jgi:hypothetical protein
MFFLLCFLLLPLFQCRVMIQLSEDILPDFSSSAYTVYLYPYLPTIQVCTYLTHLVCLLLCLPVREIARGYFHAYDYENTKTYGSGT